MRADAEAPFARAVPVRLVAARVVVVFFAGDFFALLVVRVARAVVVPALAVRLLALDPRVVVRAVVVRRARVAAPASRAACGARWPTTSGAPSC
ncbi:MAG TPA: hypothetical protein VJN88_14895, partial [Ktedonobacterales bacterium]|nr:hypothetical protein [Ktedonobacterales bacterium]